MELTKNEISIIERFSNALLNSINLNSKMKTDTTKEGYYPYIPNTDISSLVKCMIKYNLKSIADLGCGEGHILHIMGLLRYKTMGVEVEMKYIQTAKKLLNSTVNIVHKDIFDLKSNEIKFRNPGFEYQQGVKQWETPDVLYFYEPVFQRDIAFDFIDKVMELVRPGQYIFHKAASQNMTARLNEYVKKGVLVLIEAKGIWIYRKLKKKKYGKY